METTTFELPTKASILLEVDASIAVKPPTEFQAAGDSNQTIGRIAVCKICPITRENCGNEAVCNAFGCTAGGGGRRRLLESLVITG